MENDAKATNTDNITNCGYTVLPTVLSTELTIELQKEILDKMFGFTLVDESDGGEPHYVVYDEDGNEFYGSNENCEYDLSTFGGIIRYAEDRGYKMGYLSCQMDMRKVLGIS
jgi:hypothetical protein